MTYQFQLNRERGLPTNEEGSKENEAFRDG